MTLEDFHLSSSEGQEKVKKERREKGEERTWE